MVARHQAALAGHRRVDQFPRWTPPIFNSTSQRHIRIIRLDTMGCPESLGDC